MARRDLLPETPLENLGILVDAIGAALASDDPLAASAQVHFLRNYTTDLIDPYLQYHLLLDDIEPRISHGGYDTMAQELLDPASPLSAESPDVIVMSLLIDFLDASSAETGWTADDSIRQVDELMHLAVERSASLVIMNTFLPPIDSLLGETSDEYEAEIDRLNASLRELAAGHSGRVFVADFAAMYRDCGSRTSLDPRFWKASQGPFRKAFLNEYAKEIAYYVRVLKGRAKKCLVLDCDNTLWGGVIGEDGLDGIELDEQSEPGVHFRRFQEAAVALGKQGVMLALCSKNNEADVWRVLDEHASSVLQKSDLVGWRVNWENKAANLASLATELNIGLDAMVFVDDSPHERDLVSNMLPEVLVLGVPEDLESYADILTADKLFDTTAQSDEDRKRTEMYRHEAHRKELKGQYDDLTDYLKSLETVMTMHRVDDSNKARVAQLTQKTNQFNLTTRRYSVADIDAFCADADTAVHAMSVSDRYGDMGLTGVLIARRSNTGAAIDTLLLSCRILGRQLEFAFVDQCLGLLAEEWGNVAWQADYVPTMKNQQVADFWDRAGFDLESKDDGAKHYTMASVTRNADYSSIISVKME